MICTCRDPLSLGVVHRADAPCYMPEQRTWVGLTDEEVFDVWLNEMPAPDKVFYQKLCRSVEAKLKEKNT